jgi:hypothetical protein
MLMYDQQNFDLHLTQLNCAIANWTTIVRIVCRPTQMLLAFATGRPWSRYDMKRKSKTVMVKNSTNIINKTNNCLSPQIIEHSEGPYDSFSSFKGKWTDFFLDMHTHLKSFNKMLSLFQMKMKKAVAVAQIITICKIMKSTAKGHRHA